MPLRKLLILDDEPAVGQLIHIMAESLGMEARVTSDSLSFFSDLSEWVPDVVAVDLVMPNVDGVQLLRMLAERKSDVRVLLMSGLGKRVIQTAEELGASLGLTILGHLTKPFRREDLKTIFANFDLHPARPANPGPAISISDDELRLALERSEFVNHYQPQIEIQTGTVIGVEALVRWQHPVHGLLYPDTFISRIEGLGLIHELGWAVASCAFAEIASAPAELSLSLNISIESLQDLAFPDRMLALAESFGIDPRRTVLEVTESGLVRDLTRTLDVLARLRMKHFELSIDDFGTGYSMMKQLKTIPATELKIDKTFVQAAEENRSDRVMVMKTIEIGHELGLRVVAEGVETVGQLKLVHSCGSDVAQGYLFSRPEPAKKLFHWLQTYREAPMALKGLPVAARWMILP